MKRKSFSFMIRIAIISSLLVQMIVPLGALAAQRSPMLEDASPSLLEQSEPTQADASTDGAEESVEATDPNEDDANQLFLPLINMDEQEMAGTSTDSAETEAQIDETESDEADNDEVDADEANEVDADEANAPEIQAAADNSDTSPYGLGGQMSASGAILPSITNFSTDLFSGSASVNIPIEAPAGLGGMSPNISLSYSSASVNATRRSAATAHKIQAGLPGYGWNIGGLSYIADGLRYDTLVLNGMSVRIDENGNTTPHIFAKVQKDVGHQNQNVQNPGEWVVTTKDGTKYYFGIPRNGNNDASLYNKVWNENQAKTQPIETMINYDNQTGKMRRKVVKYLLREVVDTLGNRMHYEYLGETRKVSGCNMSRGVNSDQWAADANKWYHRATRPAKISWSTQGGSSTAMMSLKFNYAGRHDDNSWGNTGSCNQAQYSNYSLNNITVNVKVNNSDHVLGKYQLSQSHHSVGGNNKHLQLNSVKKYGKGGTGSELYSQNFTYSRIHGGKNDGLNGLRLVKAAHSWGGSTAFTYQQLPVGSCRRGRLDTNWNSCVAETTKKQFLLSQKDIFDGVNSGFVSRTNYGYTGGLERSDNGSVESLGHQKVTVVVKDAASTEVKYEIHEFNQRAQGQADLAALKNPHPALGKPSRVRIYQPKSKATVDGHCWGRPTWGNRCEMSNTQYTWQAKTSGSNWEANAATYNVHPRWVRLYSTKTTADRVSNEQRHFYERSRQRNSQYGNVTKVEEWSGSTKLRSTESIYYPNKSAYIVDKVAQVQIKDGSNRCKSQVRTIYDNVNATNVWTEPTKGLPVKTQVNLKTCSTSATASNSDANWNVSQTNYDQYGNPIKQISYGQDSSKNLEVAISYDGTYNLFPIEYKNVRDGNFVERIKYYGVAGSPLGISDGRAYWGATAEYCGVNELCVRQTYDAHGRPKNRWDIVASGSGWASDSTSSAAYLYFKPNTVNGNKTNIVAEWRAPRAYGNFTRTHYNGLGQVVMTQTPHQNWGSSGRDCKGQNDLKCEIATYYAYDALGNQNRVSVPQIISVNQNNLPSNNWWRSGNHSSTNYDVMGRPLGSTAPDGKITKNRYIDRATSVTLNNDAKMVKWQQTDAMGNLKLVRNYKKNGSSWTQDSQVSLTHDIFGNLTKVVNAENKTATLQYDFAGRKISMNDPDLGKWTYAYDRQSNLTRQTDARNKSTCLYYDGKTGRLAGKHFRTNTSCPSSVNPYDVRYLYDGGHNSTNRSRGQLTQILYHKKYRQSRSTAYYKNIYYNTYGLLQREVTRVPGISARTTSYVYDSYHRLSYTRYPDGEQVYNYYNSMGLPSRLYSNKHGYLVNGNDASGQHTNTVQYNEVGQLEVMRMPKGRDTWRRNYYYSWAEDNHRLKESRVDTYENGIRLMRQQVQYDAYGNISQQRRDGGSWKHFCYDHINRLTHASGMNSSCGSPEQTYKWKPSGNFQQFEGQNFGYGSRPAHAVSNVSFLANYLYDANGNMTSRFASGQPQQTLTWDHENHLSTVKWNGNTSTYLYDDSGQRIKKTQGSKSTYYINSLYEVEMNGGVRGASIGSDELGVDADSLYDADLAEILEPSYDENYDPPVVDDTPATTYLPYISAVAQTGAVRAEVQAEVQAAAAGTVIVKYYYFNGQRIAMDRNGTFTYLHGDHLGSTIAETNTNGSRVSKREYTAFGTPKSGGTAKLNTDRTYTGQQSDETGLMYYNARYYDPAIGQFISPDTIVPDPSNVSDYNRYMYVRGNPINMNDPSGHCPKPPSEYANAICIAGFIPTKESEGDPFGGIIYEGDNRDFSSDSTGQSSRFHLWVDAETGEFIGDPKNNVHPTVQLFPPQWFFGGGENGPRDSHNNFMVKKFEDGTIYVNYAVVCSSPACYGAPGPEGELYLTPNNNGTYDVNASVERFPNLEGYHWKNGELQGDSLFQVQNFSQEERANELTSFWTGMNMYDWLGKDSFVVRN